MTNCLIVDDEPLARDILAGHISKVGHLQLIKKCANAFEAFEALSRYKIDLLFLDIKMPAVSGIDFIQSLKNPPAVIFTTAFSEYAASSYDLDAVDYLLKPITFERFEKSLAKYFKLQPAPQPETVYTYFKVDGKLVKVFHVDIISAQSIKDYIIINTTQGKYITHMTMKYLAQLLPQTLFRRVHRSFLIGLQHISTIGKNEILLGDFTIPVGEHYRGEVDEIMNGIKL